MRKQTLHMIAPALVLALILSIAAVLPVTGQDTGKITDKLRELHGELEGEKPALQNKVNAVINQIEAGAFNGALNKLENDIKKSVRAWVEDPEELIELIDLIMDMINDIMPPPPPKPDFEITASDYQLDVVQGSFNTTTITVTSIRRFSQEVALTATTTASGVMLTFDPALLTPEPNDSKDSSLKVEAAANAAAGEFDINVTGTSGSLGHSVIIPLRIIEAPSPPPMKDFTITASPAALTIQQGRSNTSIISVTSVNGFNKQVNLTITPASISGVNTELRPDKVTPTAGSYAISALVIDVTADATLDTYIITATGISGVLQHSVNVTLTVTQPPVPPKPDFSLNIFPTSLTIEQGDTATSTIITTSLRGFSGAVALTLTPASILGVTLSLDPTPITVLPDSLATTTLKIEIAIDTAPNEYDITVTGTSGTLKHNASLSLKIILEKKLPKILSVSRIPEDTPAYNETVTVSANVVDLESGVQSVTLTYSTGSLQQDTTMTLIAGLYQATIPAFKYNQAIDYWVTATDNVGNQAVSTTYSYVVADPYPPSMGTPTWSPQEPTVEEEIKINVTVTEPDDASGIEQVTLHYSNSSTSASITMIDGHDGNWTAVIGNQTGPKVAFFVKAIDHAGNTAESEIQEVNLTAPAFPLAWILAAIAILAAATGGGAYYVNRRRKKGATATSVPPAAVKPVPPAS